MRDWIDDWKQIPAGQAFEAEGMAGVRYVRIDHLHPHGPALMFVPGMRWQLAFLNGPLKSRFRLTGQEMHAELVYPDDEASARNEEAVARGMLGG